MCQWVLSAFLNAASQILWVSILNREHEKLSLQKVFIWWINLLWKIQIECLVWVSSLFWGILYIEIERSFWHVIINTLCILEFVLINCILNFTQINSHLPVLWPTKWLHRVVETLYNFFMIEYHLVVCRKPPFLKAKIMVEWEEDQNELPMMTGITQANFWRCIGYNGLL